MRALTFALGAILTSYCSVGVLSENLWQSNDQVNRDLCYFFLCNNAPLISHARNQITEGGKENVQQAIAVFRRALQQDAQDPYRWADLGDAFLDAGQKEDARYCYGQVLALAPRSAPFLLRVANFHFESGNNEKALRTTARILSLVSEYDSIVFDEYTRYVDRTEDVLHFGLPEDPRAPKSWLRFLMQSGRRDDAELTWDWITERGYADDTLAGEYAEFLIGQARPELAASAWRKYLGRRTDGYGESNYIFNGDFESEPTQSPFDWNIVNTAGIKVARDVTTAWSGKSSLRIGFAGTENLDVAAASQLTLVRPGHYHFRAFIRTEGVTTDQGIRFRISDAGAPARLDAVFGQFTGSTSWSSVDHDLIVAPETRLVRIEVIRQPSMKFDSKVDGTAWIDQLKLEPITPHSPR